MNFGRNFQKLKNRLPKVEELFLKLLKRETDSNLAAMACRQAGKGLDKA